MINNSDKESGDNNFKESGDSDFHKELKQLIDNNSADKAIRKVIARLEELILNKQYKDIDRFLNKLDVTGVSKATLITILMVTLGSRNKLINRESFYRRVKERLRDSYSEFTIKQLLLGLE